LWACTNKSQGKAVSDLRKLAAADDGVRVAMDGEDGINVEFDVARWKEVFRIMGAK
jgi:hypothetical protein